MTRACLLLALAAAATPAVAAAQKPLPPRPVDTPGAASAGLRTYVSASGFASRFYNPFLREPAAQGQGASELQTRQVADIRGGKATFGVAFERFGAELGVTIFGTARLADFDYYNPQSSPDSTTYSNVSVGLWQVDLVVLGQPMRRVPLDVALLLGMGQTTKRYTISGHTLAEFNGPHELSEFAYTPGLALRFRPVRYVSLFGEFRWVPGDRTLTIPSEGCYIYVAARPAGPAGGAVNASVRGAQATTIGDCKTNTDFSRLLIAGASLVLPL